MLERARPHLTVQDFERFFEAGELSENDRVELIDGEIVALSLHEPKHTRSLMRANDTLVNALRSTHYVGSQVPVVIGQHNLPQPDFCVYRRAAVDSPGDVPEVAVLLVEVSNTSLDFDRGRKASLYASSGVPEYWIVDLRAQQVLVHRSPQADAKAVFGGSWRIITEHEQGTTLSPLARPDVRIAVSDLF